VNHLTCLGGAFCLDAKTPAQVRKRMGMPHLLLCQQSFLGTFAQVGPSGLAIPFNHTNYDDYFVLLLLLWLYIIVVSFYCCALLLFITVKIYVVCFYCCMLLLLHQIIWKSNNRILVSLSTKYFHHTKNIRKKCFGGPFGPDFLVKTYELFSVPNTAFEHHGITSG
jgi:hypothetical protein